MDTTTPTGDVDQNSSGITNDEPLLDKTNNEQSSAVEDTNDTDQSESSDSGSDTSSTTEESSSDNSEKEIEAFAKSQGLDIATMTETEKKLVTQLRNQSVIKRKEIDQKASKEFDKTLEDVTPTADPSDAIAQVNLMRAQIQAKNAKDTFWNENPDDRQYEAKMSELLLKEKEDFGDAAAWQLAQNLPRLLREAKFANGDFNSDAARDAGRREEREELRRKQEGGADSLNATSTSSSTSTGAVTLDWIENEYSSNNPEDVKKLDAWMQSGKSIS